ncbi:Bax inhibitor-1 family protein [Falsihalocynthiibacter sp. BN13B15]|uniref:Bax inhibitor-1/YccA family protein n=1 Tax=Falsihalocynthiibacter sp. BN13B15 TaxID=3240871 RepID=UPI00350F4CDB
MAQFDTARTGTGTRSATIDAGLRAHMNKVYGTMSVGLLITALAAWAIGNMAMTSDPSLAVSQISDTKYLTALGNTLYGSPLKWVIMFLPLGMVFGFSAMINKLSAAGAQLFFYAFATAMGLSLSSIFLMYTGASIVQVFLVTSIAFAGLSLYGYTTKKDLSAMGTFLMMGVIGLLVAMVVNLFLQSGALMFAISAIGVLIFAGLTAYDTQKIKNDYIAHAQHGDSEWMAKSAIMGALNLYLDFINMFMFMLQLFGNRN